MVLNVLLVCLLSLLATRTGALNCTTSDFCRCEGTDGGKEFTIDLGYILKSFKTNTIPDTTSEGKDSYTYTLSPCSPLACVSGGTANGVACQNHTYTGAGLVYVARNTVPAKWAIGSLSPLQFVVVYGDGDKSTGPTLTRVAEVDFSEDTTNDIEMFDEVKNTDPEVLTLTYKFRVSGPSVTPAPSPVPLTCEPVSGDEFCSCRGNGFTIDLRHILTLPVDDIPDKSGEGEAKYSYSFNPCTPFDCQRKGVDNGLVCQRVTREGQPVEYVNIARDTVAANWTIYSVSPLKFEVLYGGGDRTTDTPVLTRKAKVAFGYTPTDTDAVMNREEFDGEAKTLTYDFQITGKNVTVSSMSCEPVLGDEFCSCNGINVTIDLRHILPLPLQNIPDARQEYKEKYHYTISPCTPFDCQRTGPGVGNGLICQSITREGQMTEYVTIARDTVPANWTVYSASPLKFEVLYGGGDSTGGQTRQAKLSFIHSSDGCTLNAFVASEATAGTNVTYIFEINGTAVTASDSTTVSSTDNFQVGLVNKKNIEAEKDMSSRNIILPIILGVMIVLAGVVCFIAGILTGYCKWGKFLKFGADRKQGWILFNQDPATHQKTCMNG